MVRPAKEDIEHREKISVTIPKELVDWVDDMVKRRAFASRSHGVEISILLAKEREKELIPGRR